MAGKVSSELQTIIRKRPKLFADLIRALKDQPDHAVLRIAKGVDEFVLKRADEDLRLLMGPGAGCLPTQHFDAIAGR